MGLKKDIMNKVTYLQLPHLWKLYKLVDTRVHITYALFTHEIKTNIIHQTDVCFIAQISPRTGRLFIIQVYIWEMYTEQGTSMYIYISHHLNNLEKAEQSHKTSTRSRHCVKLFFFFNDHPQCMPTATKQNLC